MIWIVCGHHDHCVSIVLSPLGQRSLIQSIADCFKPPFARQRLDLFKCCISIISPLLPSGISHDAVAHIIIIFLSIHSLSLSVIANSTSTTQIIYTTTSRSIPTTNSIVPNTTTVTVTILPVPSPTQASSLHF